MIHHRSSSSTSSSKTRRQCSPAPETAPKTVDLKTGRRRKQSHRSPLKEHNVITSSSSCSSTSSSVVSNDAPKGCLRFFLSNSSSSSRTPLYRPTTTRTLVKTTPKSAPIVRPSNFSRSKPSIENRSKPSFISGNQERPTSQKLQKSKNNNNNNNNTPCLLNQYGKKKPSFIFTQKAKPSADSNTSGISVNNQASDEPEELEQQQQLECLVRSVGDSGTDIIKDVNFTPASKLPFGSVLDCAFLDKAIIIDENSNINISTTTPPVEASLSPEIQCGLLPLDSTTTPICYGAGHVISGVTDKRKCKPRGILTIGEKSLEFDKVKIFDDDDNDDDDDDDDDDEVLGAVSNSRVSLVPLPIEASMHWLLSPCNEEDEVIKNGLCDKGSNRFRSLVTSPSSGHGFCFNVCNSSSNESAGTTTISSRRRRRRRRRSNSLLSPCGLPELQGLFSPLSDEMGGCSLPSSPHATPTCKVIVLEEENKHRHDLTGKNSPFSLNSLGSGNVIQTPQSDSSPDRDVGPCLHNEKHLFEPELDCVAEVLQRTSFSPKSQISMWDPAGSSFQFDHLTTPSNSIDFMQLQKNWDQASWISNSMTENVSQSQMRISWREGLVSRIFEMDDLDCCRCLSDEEEDANGCSNVPFTSHLSPELNFDVSNDQILPSASGSPKFVGHEKENDGRVGKEFSLQGPSSCAESISTDGGGLLASGDSDWTLCYRNGLFEV